MPGGKRRLSDLETMIVQCRESPVSVSGSGRFDVVQGLCLAGGSVSGWKGTRREYCRRESHW